LNFFKSQPHLLLSSKPEEITTFLGGVVSELQKLEDNAEVKADPIEKDDEVSITLEKTLESLQRAIDYPGAANRLAKEIKPSLQQWADNSPDIEEQNLLPTTTSDEWYEILDKVGDTILESPAAAEKGFWAIANPVANWKESTKGKSREHSRPETPQIEGPSIRQAYGAAEWNLFSTHKQQRIRRRYKQEYGPGKPEEYTTFFNSLTAEEQVELLS